MSIICFFGPDGSGKTTIAKALMKELKSKGFKVIVSWMRGTHTLASLLAKLLSQFNAFKGSDNPYYGISIPNGMKRIWQLIEFVSVLPILFIRFMLPRFLGYIIVAERYLPDFLVWVSLTTRDTGYLRSLEAKFMLTLSIKADVKIYMTASETELVRRRSGEVDHEFLRKQLKLYDNMAELIRAYKIDTTGRGVEETLGCLLNLINSRS